MRYCIKSTLLLLLLCTACAANAGVRVKPPVEFGPDAHLYILSVGIDDYSFLYGMKTAGSGNDTRMLSDSLTKRFVDMAGDSNALKRVHVKRLVDASATRQNIVAELNSIIKNIRTNDVFFFSFSGHMLERIYRTDVVLDDPCIATWHPDTLYPRTKEGIEKTFLGLKELRALLELMPNRYQMILFDACNEKDLAQKFAATMLEDVPDEQVLSQRNRILISAEGLSYEYVVPGSGQTVGALSYVVAIYRNLFEVFEANTSAYHQKQIKDNASRTGVYRHVQFSVYSEQSIIDNLRRFCKCSRGGTRGADVSNTAMAPAIPVKKDRAIIIATNEYEHWSKLRTPLNDAREMEKLLASKYNFDTRLLINISKDSLMKEMRALTHDSVTEHQQLFLFFAGHGHYNPEMLDGFLVMKESKPLEEDPNMLSYFQFSYLSTFANNLKYNHVFVMLDVCFGGRFGGNNKEVVLKPQAIPSDITPVQYRERKKDAKGRLYLASGIKEVDDVSGRNSKHSPFADKVLEKLTASSTALTPQDLYLQCEKNSTAPVFRKLPDHEDNSEFFFIPTDTK
jgi:uncharacterized caspase-like protein